MLKESFNYGPFTIEPLGQRYRIWFGLKIVAHGVDASGETRQQVIADLSECFSRLHAEMRQKTPLYRINLIDANEELLSFFYSENEIVLGMVAGLPNDTHQFWMQSENKLFSAPVSITVFAFIKAKYEALKNQWIANLLCEEVLTEDPEKWRAPTSWEIRHVVGEGSCTGISGAKAAELVGITPQNFRKYTANDSAKNRQSISYATWHLLLKKLGVTK